MPAEAITKMANAYAKFKKQAESQAHTASKK